MVFLSPPNSNGLLLSTFQARTNPPLTRALAQCYHRGQPLFVLLTTIGSEEYKLAAPKILFFSSICHAIIDPPVTKIRLWASFGV